MAYHLTAQELNQAICKKYALETFNCLLALFGVYVKGQTYLISVSANKIKELKKIQSEFFESYVEDCVKIYEYLLSIGYEGDVYIK